MYGSWMIRQCAPSPHLNCASGPASNAFVKKLQYRFSWFSGSQYPAMTVSPERPTWLRRTRVIVLGARIAITVAITVAIAVAITVTNRRVALVQGGIIGG